MKRQSRPASSARDFSVGSMHENILSQAVPLVIAQLIQLLYNIVDRIYIGHLPSEGALALAGIGLVFPFTTLILAFASLCGTGGTPLFSMARGAKEPERAKQIMGNVCTLLLLISAALLILCYLFLEPVLYLFGASDATLPYAAGYLHIYLLGVPASLLVTGLNGFISALGFPKTAMATTIVGAGLNLILDPILIFGCGMGVEGAALSTVISQYVSAAWVMHFLLDQRRELPLTRSALRLRLPLVRRIAALGISGFMQQATNCAVQVAANATLQNFGGDLYVGIMTIVNSVREIASLPVLGLANGSQPVLGYNYGAQKRGRVKSGIRFIAVAGLIYTLVIWLLIEGFPGAFLRLFSTDAATISFGIPAVRIYFFGFLFMSLQFIGQSVFVGLGKSGRAVFFSVLRKIVIVVPLTLLLPRCFSLGADGVFLAEPISNLIGGLACFVTMYLTLYRRL